MKRKTVLLSISLVMLLLPIQYSFPMWVDAIIITAFYAFAFFLIKTNKVTPDQIGITISQFKKGVIPAAIVVTVIGLAFSAAFFINDEIFKDDRYDKTLTQTLLYALITIPLATAIFEELLFRGILLARLQKYFSFRKSQILSSILFGFWHVLPSIGVQTSLISEDLETFKQLITISVIVVATFVAGMILSELKKRFDSLLVPIAAHWAINGLGIVFAYLAWNAL